MNYNEFGGGSISSYWKDILPDYGKDIHHEINEQDLSCFKDSKKCFVCTLIHICDVTYNSTELTEIKDQITRTIRNSPAEKFRNSVFSRTARKVKGETTSRRKGLQLIGDNRKFCLNEAKFKNLNNAEYINHDGDSFTFHLCKFHMPRIDELEIGRLNDLEMQNLRGKFRARMLKFINERQFLNRKKEIARKGLDAEYQKPIKTRDKQIKKLNYENSKLNKKLKQVENDHSDKLLLKSYGFTPNVNKVGFGSKSKEYYSSLSNRRKKIKNNIKYCKSLYEPTSEFNKTTKRSQKLKIAKQCHPDKYGFSGTLMGTYGDYEEGGNIENDLLNIGGQGLLDDYLEERGMLLYTNELSKSIMEAAVKNQFLGGSKLLPEPSFDDERKTPSKTTSTIMVPFSSSKNKKKTKTTAMDPVSINRNKNEITVTINKNNRPTLPPRPMRLNPVKEYELDEIEPEVEPPPIFTQEPDAVILPYKTGELIPHIEGNNSDYFPLVKKIKNHNIRIQLKNLKKDERLTYDSIYRVVIGFIKVDYEKKWASIYKNIEYNLENIEVKNIEKADYINNNQHIVELNKSDIEKWFTDYVKYYDQLINCFKLVAGEKKKCKTPKISSSLVWNSKCGVLEFARKYAKYMNGGDDKKEEEIGYYSKEYDGKNIVKLPQVEIKTCDKNIFKIYNPYLDYEYNPVNGIIYGTNNKYYYHRIKTGQDDISKYCRENLQNKIKLQEALPGSIDQIFHIQGVSKAYTGYPRIEWFVEIGEDDKDYKSLNEYGNGIIPKTLSKYLPYTIHKCDPKDKSLIYPISLAWFISPKNKKRGFLIEFFRFLFECHTRGFYFNETLDSNTILYKQYHGYGENSFEFKLSQKVQVVKKKKSKNGRKYKDFKKHIEREGALLSNFLFGNNEMSIYKWYLLFLTDIYYYSIHSGVTTL